MCDFAPALITFIMRTGFTALFLIVAQLTFGQYISDQSALWSRTGLSGTARTIGSGGAYGSVGADMGCIGINPAGLALYRSTDFCITPMLQLGNNESVYNLSHTLAHRTGFFLAQGGFVFTKLFKSTSADNQLEPTNKPVRSFSFALNFQQQNSFDRNQSYAATNNSHSLIEGYTDYINAINQPISFSNYPPEMVVAGYANLITQNPLTGAYESAIKSPVAQSGSIASRGGINRIDMAFGLNFLDKLYFGVDLAVPIINYSLTNDFTEQPLGSSTVTDYSFNTVTTQSGFGFNGILGLIYRPVSWMRIGAAYHLPTWYSMTENYELNYLEDSVGIPPFGIGPLNADPFKYNLRTPMKGSFSASFYYRQYGFISIDYDMQNLGSSRVHIANDTADENAINNDIKSNFKLTHTIHAGLEAAIKIVRLRAGYSFSTSPYKKDGPDYTKGYVDSRNAVTAGIGVRLKHFYADFAYVYGWTKDASVQLSNYNFPVNSIYSSSTLMLTIGWKFDASNNKNSQQRTQQRRYTPPPVDGDQRY